MIEPLKHEELVCDSAQAHARLDGLERAMLDSGLPVIEQPVEHRFVPGLYIRKIFNPAGSLLTTKIHKTTHPYFVMQGRVSVFTPGKPTRELEAPFYGITEAGTRRVIGVHEDTVWITVHPNPDDGQDLDAIEERLIERRELRDGKTAFEHYAAMLFRADTARQLAVELNPDKEIPPIDYAGLVEQAVRLAQGLPAEVSPEVQAESDAHLLEFGLRRLT